MNSKLLAGAIAVGMVMIIFQVSGLAYFSDTEKGVGTITAAEMEKEKKCVYLGKIEIVNDNVFTIDSGDKNDNIIDTSENKILLVAEDEGPGDNSLLYLKGTKYKEGELTGFYFEVIEGVKICKVSAFGGLDTDNFEYNTCMRQDWIETDLVNPNNPQGKQAGISHIDFWYCDWTWSVDP